MPPKNLNVCYVVYAEEIWSPLLRRQVLELLQTAARSESRLKTRLLYIFPWYWKIIRRKQLRAFAKEFDATPLELKFLPLPFPFPFPYLLPKYIKGLGFRPYEPDSALFFWVAKLLVLPFLLKYVLADHFHIFHCRSYPAAAILLPLKKLYKKVKLVFDPRSDYPEENLLQSSWAQNGRTFAYWKRQEKALLRRANVTVCISELYQRHYQQRHENFNFCVIPNNVDTSGFCFNPEARQNIRSRLGFEDKIVFCYLGSMATGSWHCPTVYAKLMREFRHIRQPYLFLFLVPQQASAQLEREMHRQGIDSHDYLIISPDYQDVPGYLSAADYGLLYLEKEKIALGTKVVEYNAVGLPVLVNSNVRSAAAYVQEHQTGFVLDIGLGGLDQEKTPLASIDFANFGAATSREKIAQTAVALFSNKKVAADYVQVYQSLEV